MEHLTEVKHFGFQFLLGWGLSRLAHSRLPIIGALLLTLAPVTAFSQDRLKEQFAQFDPAKIVSAEPCGECHKSEYEVWKKTPHAEGFKTLHRKKSAEEIAGKLGFKLIKRESICLQCHFTTQEKDGELRAISGVSCESCHGAAKDWLSLHNNYSGFNHQTEPAEQKNKRIASSKAGGMLRPSELYEVVANCFQCHTVPNERLVNVGGHTSGSNFELLQWVDKIRHNFLQAQFDPARTENIERSPERKRVMYVAGRALDLEYSLRGVAKAKEEGVYLKAMIRRTRSATGELNAILERASSIAEVKEMLAIARQAKIGTNNERALDEAANKIGQATKKFIINHDGSRLAAIDKLMQGIEEVAETPVVETPPPGAAPKEGAREVEPSKATEKKAARDTGEPPGAVKTEERKAVIPPIKNRLHPPSTHKTLGPSNCSCHNHNEQNKWWTNDKHYAAADPFLDEKQKNVQIARLYGLSTAEMRKGNNLCMDCHGTVISGKETREADIGVSCESCHGAGADFREPHQEGDRALGVNRPGYVKALQLGMVELKNLDKRATACAQCHYIAESRLISTGHPTGANFDFAGGLQKIRHWQSRLHADAELKAAYNKIIAARGPLSAFASVASTTEVANRGQVAPAGADEQRARPIRPLPPAPRPVDPIALPPENVGRLDLQPFPTISDSASVEEILLILKQRLELLYQKVGKEK